jgi:hypothetical protein
VDEQEQPASPETPAPGPTVPVSGPVSAPEGRYRQADGVREALTSRGAGWAVAAAMAGAVVGLSVSMATSPAPTVVVQPEGAAGLRGVPALFPAPQVQAPGKQVSAAALTPRAVRVRVQRGQVRVRVRLRIPGNARIRALPASPPGRLQLVVPGARPLAVVPAVTPARLRIVFQRGVPVPARLLLPATLPGQARLRIQIPARARVTPARPAPPNW